jgi:hypothetical protein
MAATGSAGRRFTPIVLPDDLYRIIYTFANVLPNGF